MSYYFLANIRINNEEDYRRYLVHADEVFSRYGGTYLAVDNHPRVLEGEWNYDRAVLIRFGRKEDFEAWYYSGEYQKILAHRLAGANCDAILMEGKT